jgi:hypothetical protein
MTNATGPFIASIDAAIEFAAFDALPRRLRDVLQVTARKWSAASLQSIYLDEIQAWDATETGVVADLVLKVRKADMDAAQYD